MWLPRRVWVVYSTCKCETFGMGSLWKSTLGNLLIPSSLRVRLPSKSYLICKHGQWNFVFHQRTSTPTNTTKRFRRHIPVFITIQHVNSENLGTWCIHGAIVQNFSHRKGWKVQIMHFHNSAPICHRSTIFTYKCMFWGLEILLN